MPRTGLPTSDPATVARWLTRYSAEHHPIEVQVDHRLDPADNEVVFRVSDWDAFTAIMDAEAGSQRRSAS